MSADKPVLVVSNRALGWLLFASLAAHVVFLALGRTVLADWRWPHEPFHAVVEAAGAFIALAMVPLLHSLERRGEGTSFNRVICNAICAMGLLDGFHATVHAGNAFVGLHSVATLAGGLLFALAWAPKGSLPHRFPTRWVVLGSVIIGAGSLAFSGFLPLMVENGEFTALAKTFNIVGGIGLFAGAARLVVVWRRTQRPDDLLFVVHALLFGAAAIMFEQSALWDAAWWGWHGLRLAAYGVALYYTVLSVRYEEQLAERAKALEDANIALQQFAYSASHDLREPLRTMSGYAQLVQDEYSKQLDERGVRWLQRITGGTERLERLLAALLDYTRAGDEGTDTTETALNAVVDEAVDSLEALIQQRDASIFVMDDLPLVLADPAQLRLVFQNVLSNAIKFCETAPRIEVSASVSDAWCQVAVDDNGVGIPVDQRERAFQLFKRLSGGARAEGTGLGLAICRRIVERHGGKIWIEAGKGGHGTRVCFTLRASTVDYEI